MLEHKLLAGIITSIAPERSLEIVLSKTQLDDFDGDSRTFIELIQKRYEDNKDISMLTLLEVVRHPILLSLTNYSDQLTNSAIVELAEAIHVQGQRKRFAKLANLIQTQSDKDGFSPQELLQEIDKNVLEITRSGKTEALGPDMWLPEMKRQSIRNEGAKMLGPTTGFPTIDKATKGLQPESYWILAGETNVGKSMAMQRMVLGALDNGTRALVISLELSTSEMGYRFASMRLKRRLFDLRTSRLDTIPGYRTFVDFVSKAGLYLSDSAVTLDDVVYQIKSAVRKLQVGLVVVDYLQNVKVPKAKGEYDSLNEVTLTLQRLAKQLQICIIAISQVNRETAKNDTKTMYGLKGSGNLENSADIAIIIFEDEEKMINMFLAKNRLFGTNATVTVEKNVDIGKFEEVAVTPGGQDEPPF